MSDTIIKYCGNCKKSARNSGGDSGNWFCVRVAESTKDSCDIANDLQYWQWDGKNMGPRLQLEAIQGGGLG